MYSIVIVQVLINRKLTRRHRQVLDALPGRRPGFGRLRWRQGARRPARRRLDRLQLGLVDAGRHWQLRDVLRLCLAHFGGDFLGRRDALCRGGQRRGGRRDDLLRIAVRQFDIHQFGGFRLGYGNVVDVHHHGACVVLVLFVLSVGPRVGLVFVGGLLVFLRFFCGLTVIGFVVQQVLGEFSQFKLPLVLVLDQLGEEAGVGYFVL